MSRPSDQERRRRTAELLARAAGTTGAERSEALEEIVHLHMPVADSVAARYAGRGVPLEDLRQVAYLALHTSAGRYDAQRAGEDFLSYAVPTMRGEIRRHFRDRGWMVRPTRRIQELQARVLRAREELTAVKQRAPRTSEIVAHLDEREADVVEALMVSGCFAPTSLDVPVRTAEGDTTLGDLQVGPEDEIAAAEARLIVRPLLDSLSEPDRHLILRRFQDGLSQREIGDELGMTQVQVSRRLHRLLGVMREQIAGDAAGVEAA